MSTDPTQPLRAPASPPEEPETEQPQAAQPTVQPTVQAPAVKAPAPPAPPVPPPGLPSQPAAPWGQEAATRAVPKWQAPPPPPPPPPGPGPKRTPQARQDPPAPPPTRAEQQPPTSADPAPPAQRDQRPQATRFDTPPAQRDRPPQRQPTQRPQPPQPPPPQPHPQPQQWDKQPSGWTEPRPWVEPRDGRPGQQPAQPPAPGQWGQPPASQGPPGQQPRLRGRRRKRRVRRSVMALFTVIVLLILLAIADRVALAVTENAFASQIQQQGLPVKPNVTIRGFPFLTQLAAKDFNEVGISASNVPVQLPSGAGTITITSVNATISGMHISSFSSSASARVDQMNATVFVSFGALAAAGGIGGTGVTVTPVNSNTVKISANLGGILSDSEEAQITTTDGKTVNIKVLPNNNSALGSVLSSFGSFSFPLPPGVPASLRITDLSLNSQGLTIKAAAANATFGSGK